MKHLITLLILVHCFQFSYSQVSDDFSDADFNSNPCWSGDTTDFMVNSVKQLQLHAAVAGTSTLTTAVDLSGMDTIEWRFYIELDFSPSSQNNTKYYLYSTQNNFANADGYYLQFGESGSNDAIQFYKQSGNVNALLGRGVDARVASAFGVSIKVVKYPNGLIEIYTDYTGGNNYQLEFFVNDNMNLGNGYLGWQCTYTVSNTSGFYLDNVYAGSFIRDTVCPFLIDSKMINDSIIEIDFNEPIKGFKLNTNFQLLQSSNNPVNIFANNDSSIFQIELANQINSGDTLKFLLKDIQDVSSNTADTILCNLVFIRCDIIAVGDLVISEVMCHPSGANNLPNVEYLELYNISNKYLATKSLTLSDPSSTGIFSNDTICPKCYVVFTSASGKLQLEANGIDAKVVSGFPTLNNDGDELVLKDSSNVLDILNYNTSFYHNEFKSQGGWSLEKIQLDYMCANSNNWSASCDARGGSPGLANCSNHIFIDADYPMVQSVFVIDSNHLSVVFNEEINADSLSANDFIIDEQINPISISADKTYTSKIHLQVNLTLLPNEAHWLQLNDIIDCNGNKILRDNKYQFGVGVTPDADDLIINEIMFNPYDNCVDFVEMYNKSDKIISLKSCSCSRRNSTSNQVEYNSKITTDDLVIMPKDYLVLSNTNDNYFNCYPSAQISKSVFYELPSMNDDEGSILFLDAAAVVIDELKYSEKLHSQLLTTNEGVSLERISADVPASNDKNWSSASYASGYATPTLKNSQAIDGSTEETIISITPTVFSPDNDGFDDHTLIEINSNIGGAWSFILILDLNGNKIKQLLNADLIGGDDKLIWDGTDERNRILPSGIYILYAEIITEQGQVQKIRKPIVVAEHRN
ncbi:MAG: hypothetical protein RL516_313 [Bacteroidota bacterium]|jgi:hypothetical protein